MGSLFPIAEHQNESTPQLVNDGSCFLKVKTQARPRFQVATLVSHETFRGTIFYGAANLV